jgi:hypothetical protein
VQPLTVVEPVGGDDLLSLVENVGHVNTDDLLGSGPGSEHGEDTRAASDLYRQSAVNERGPSPAHIENDLVLEQVRVLLDRITVREGTDGILEHFLVDS